MDEWIEVNGARVEKAYFEENLHEARTYQWSEANLSESIDHVHCMICGLAIGGDDLLLRKLYQSSGGSLCVYCYENIVLSDQ
jgi:hypothetical protein